MIEPPHGVKPPPRRVAECHRANANAALDAETVKLHGTRALFHMAFAIGQKDLRPGDEVTFDITNTDTGATYTISATRHE